jgi:3-deoxy-manno-octulosonate cytidylyltransferase (CMP-KDO synthetase)
MKKSKAICVIPARYASTRLPGKPLLKIKGLPLIMWVYNRISRSGAFDEVIIATDDKRILDTAGSYGAKAVMTSRSHRCGTDRVAEAVKNIRCDYVVNIQGDEPLIPKRLLKDFRASLGEIDDDCLLTCATNATIKEMNEPSVVKVALAADGHALYFSRSPIPYCRSGRLRAYKHTGIYGFTKNGLNTFCKLPPGRLERSEQLEQLRALEAGMRIRCLVRKYSGMGIDTPHDLNVFRRNVGSRK